VEFDWASEHHRGIIYLDGESGFRIAAEEGTVPEISWVQNLSRTGSASISKGILGAHDAVMAAKTYFSTPTFTGSYAERQKASSYG
jgi:hypothetical protein